MMGNKVTKTITTSTLQPVHSEINEIECKMIVERNMHILERTFASFGVDASNAKPNDGASCLQNTKLTSDWRGKVSKIVNSEDDIVSALAAKDIRIEAPIPGNLM